MTLTRSTTAYIGLGANLGDAKTALLQAAEEIRSIPGVERLRLSPLYRTAPIDSSGPDYLNAVAEIQTALAAHPLLRALQEIEQRHGRMRPYRNAPRTLDLDILLFGSDCINEPMLTIPHPRMHERAFVLRPLYDLAPELALSQGSLQSLLAQCTGQKISQIPLDRNRSQGDSG